MRVTTRSAFTLLELLIVIAVIAVLAVLVQTGIGPTLTAYRLTTAAQAVNDQINLARQLAVSQNQYVQVRFLAPRNELSSPHYQAIAIFIAESPFYAAGEAEYEALKNSGRFRREGPVRWLPESSVIAKSPTLSGLLDWLEHDPVRPRTGVMQILGTEHDWVGFYFRPNGSVDMEAGALEPGRAGLTLAPIRALDAEDSIPDNFATLALDPVTGRTQWSRP